MSKKPNGQAGPITAAVPKATTPPTVAAQTQTAQQKLDQFLDDQAQLLTIDDTNLSAEFSAQANKFLQAASRHNKAVNVLAMVKIEVDALQADKRGGILAGKDKKPTEGEIDAQLSLDPEVQAARKKKAYAEMQAGQYQSVVRAWEHKRDMLIQMGSTHRAEMHAGISISDPPNAKTSRPTSPTPRTQAMQDDYFEE